MPNIFSTFPTALQKQVEGYFERRSEGEAAGRFHVPAGKKSVLPEAIQDMLQGLEACVIARLRVNSVDLMVMIPSSNISSVINICIDELDVVSFYLKNGAITVSADKEPNGDGVEMHLVVIGELKKDFMIISDRVGASTY